MEPAVLRDDMVDSLEHESKGVVRSDRVGLAMREVPRHEFVDDEQGAYADAAQRSHGTRVLAPSTVARLIEALAPEPGDEVLVVGAGVGYTAAVLAEVVGARHVHAIDITRQLVFEARSNLATAGYSEVLVDCRDGAEGLAEYAPFDRILVEAAAVEPPRALVRQLADDGQLVMPLGAGQQSLTIVHADGEREPLGGVAFAPLLVEGEQAGAVERNRTAREERERADRQAQRRAGWEHDWIDWD
ncbi:protein-L-isoaspartate(D-aspartate) O-methyltransferase [Salinarchaeum sp. Harcht-Bsk1]|uniref:protein-L-isoaspartate O-methyltransferase family protein n=1 Tax=Salinarchaeum sp. Harcht-Bsk1 TaxID=1333523 RepID=UPI0003422881|nr:protein-L-isoaspartate O-methyltransferase [Salinarchaeum sp. Harcht-Bsk1]AGN01760.1 protein-L-isoaspartate(D-aspartate) O-methyltransferase [Salinarchaeum sp. Harcht-Bsk1]